MYEGDGLPSQICHQCLDELDRHFKFKQKCQGTDAQLRQYLKNSGTVQEQTINMSQVVGITPDFLLYGSLTHIECYIYKAKYVEKGNLEIQRL